MLGLDADTANARPVVVVLQEPSIVGLEMRRPWAWPRGFQRPVQDLVIESHDRCCAFIAGAGGIAWTWRKVPIRLPSTARGAMKLHRCARGLVAACFSVIALAGGLGVAWAQPQPAPPPLPPAIDPLLPINPALTVNPNDDGDQTSVQGDFGRFCENWWVHCQ